MSKNKYQIPVTINESTSQLLSDSAILATETYPLPAVIEGPIYKAFSIDRVKHGWVFITITYSGNEIVAIERCEPDLKVIIIEKYKIASQRYFNSIG